MRPSFVVLLSSLVGQPRRLFYDHGHHCGNFADVAKHSVLILLLQHMRRKNSPFAYVETHSGAGLYPLLPRLPGSERPPEHERGISLLLNKLAKKSNVHVPQSTRDLLALISKLSPDENMTYPGSPLIAARLCRQRDSLLFCENAPDPYDLLKSNLGTDPRATLLLENGYKALKQPENVASQKRALVFLDPPYQLGSDTEQIAALVSFLQKHWRSARIAIWHPISETNVEKTSKLYSAVQKAVSHDSDILACELDSVTTDVGSGMLMINPPYGIDKDIQELFSELGHLLQPPTAMPTEPAVLVEWLNKVK